MSLDNLAGLFNWIKTHLKPKPYYPLIAWSENDDGEFDARDIIAMMFAFNIDAFPNDEDEQPVASYEKKSVALKQFEKNADSFMRMKPILADILYLHDVIRKEARHLYTKSGGKGGSLAFVEKRSRDKKYNFPFTGETDEFRLMNGALYPMLGAFRWFVERDPVNLQDMHWRGGFDNVLKNWESVSAELMRATMQTSFELGRNPNAIGKSRNHWANLHTRVAKHDLISRQAASP